MKTILSTIFISFFLISNSFGQSEFMVTVSNDSILLGNYFQATFTLKNQSGQDFHPPSFKDYEIVSGPNQSMSSTFINGEMSQTISYSYLLRPKEIGTYYIEPADIQTESGILETVPIEINVFPNPDNIQQDIPNQRESFDPFEKFNGFDLFEFPSRKENLEKKKKKRRVYKI